MLEEVPNHKQFSKTGKTTMKTGQLDLGKDEFFADPVASEEHAIVDTDRRTSFPRVRVAHISENPFKDSGKENNNGEENTKPQLSPPV